MTQFHPRYDFSLWPTYALPATVVWVYCRQAVEAQDLVSAVLAGAGLAAGLLYILSRLPVTVDFADNHLTMKMYSGRRFVHSAGEVHAVHRTHFRVGHLWIWLVNMRNADELLRHVDLLPVDPAVRAQTAAHTPSLTTLRKFTMALPPTRGFAAVLCLSPLYLFMLHGLSVVWIFGGTLLYFAAVDPLFAVLLWTAHLRNPVDASSIKERRSQRVREKMRNAR